MSKLLTIKEEQIKNAEKEGLPNPYHVKAVDDSVSAKAVKEFDQGGSNRGDSKVQKIKAAQLEETPDLYVVKEPVAKKSTDTASLIGIGHASFEQFKAAMDTDIARIKTAKKLEDKTRLKTELLPSYLEFVKDYMSNGHDYPNSVAVQVMIWLFDTGDIEQGLELGLYLDFIDNQVMPAWFKRDLISFISDAVYDWAKEQLDNKQTASPYLDNLVDHIKASEHDLHPAVVSKNLAMLAKHCEREEKFAECVELCERAEAVNPEGAGVKTMKNKALAKVEAAKAG